MHLLEEQGGSSVCEHLEWCLHGQDNGNVGEVFVDTTHCVEEKLAIGDGLSDITEGVHEHFLTLAVGGDGKITLD